MQEKHIAVGRLFWFCFITPPTTPHPWQPKETNQDFIGTDKLHVFFFPRNIGNRAFRWGQITTLNINSTTEEQKKTLFWLVHVGISL